MSNCTQAAFDFPPVKRRRVQAQFSGGEVTSDGGVMLLRQADQLTGLMEAIDRVIPDPRDPDLITHTQLSLLRQRVYALALGYEDLNDHERLRTDPAIQTAVDRDTHLGSQATLCRLEQRGDRALAVAIHRVLVEHFIASFDTPPEALVLDFDATDDPVHGRQEGRFFHGYYDRYCFLPLYVFCGDQLLVAYLRRSNIDAAKHAWAILSLLVKRLRQAWPKVRITFRGDSGFCRWRMLRWCERQGVSYLTGLARNERLEAKIGNHTTMAEISYRESREKIRWFTEFPYTADTWDRERRVIAKIEHGAKGPNPRFVLTNLTDDPETLYTEVYCARGDMENRIKEQQLGLFADRTSCHAWWPNQFRLLLSSLAYTLLEAIRRLALHSTELANAYVSTIRLKLLKIGAVITRNTRRIRFLLSSAYPYQRLFAHVAARLHPT